MTEMLLTLPKLQACLVLAEVAAGQIHLFPVKVSYEKEPTSQWKIAVPAGHIYIREQVIESGTIGSGGSYTNFGYVIDVSECYNAKSIPADLLRMNRSTRLLTESLARISKWLNTDPAQNLSNEHDEMYEEKLRIADYLEQNWKSCFPDSKDVPEHSEFMNSTLWHVKRVVNALAWKIGEYESLKRDLEEIARKPKNPSFWGRIKDYLVRVF